MDERDALVDLLNKRVAAGFTPAPRKVQLVADLYGLGFALVPFVSSPTVDVSGFRRQGRIAADGSGFVIESDPYGGSVIEGYHDGMRAVLASGAVLTAEQLDMHPSGTAELHGDSPELDTLIAHANQDARVRIAADHTVWPALHYGVLSIVRARFGWPALASGQHESLSITTDGATVRFTYDRRGSASGTARLTAGRDLTSATWDDHFDGS